MTGALNKDPLVVVVTGGIASGKTTVSDQFAAMGVPVIDTDLIARDVVVPGSEGLEQIREAFGKPVLHSDGSLDRSRLRIMIFEDDDARNRLESILHPLIMAEVEKAIGVVAAPYCIVVIPLYTETSSSKELADVVIVVDVDEGVQAERLMARDKIDRETTSRMLAAQAKRETRLSLADYVISNEGTPEALKEQVVELDRILREKVAQKRQVTDS